MQVIMRLCDFSDLPDGKARGFDPQSTGQDTMLIVRQGEQLFAWENRCPHHGTPMAWRKDAFLNAAGNRIVCGAHGAQFEIRTGVCTLGPCLGDTLNPVPVFTNNDGEVHLVPHHRQETNP